MKFLKFADYQDYVIYSKEDCKIDLFDFVIFAETWIADDITAFAKLSENWLNCSFPNDPGCETIYLNDKMRVLQLSTYNYDSITSINPHRIPLRARESLAYYLKGLDNIEVDNAFEDNFAGHMNNLYAYDVLVLNDFNSPLLAPYKNDISNFQYHLLSFY